MKMIRSRRRRHDLTSLGWLVGFLVGLYYISIPHLGLVGPLCISQHQAFIYRNYSINDFVHSVCLTITHDHQRELHLLIIVDCERAISQMTNIPLNRLETMLASLILFISRALKGFNKLFISLIFFGKQQLFGFAFEV